MSRRRVYIAHPMSQGDKIANLAAAKRFWGKKMLGLGIHENVSFADYLAEPGASRSFLSRLLRSPAHARVPFEASPALRLGSAIHASVLEPQAFADRYYMLPPGDGRTKAVKEFREGLRAIHAGKTPLDADEWATVHCVSLAVLQSPSARRLLTGRVEIVAIWDDPDTGVRCKARADVLNDDLRLIADVKTTEDASPQAFKYSVRKYSYETQDAFYTDGFKICGIDCDAFVFVAVEKSQPFGLACYTLSESMKMEGREKYKQALRVYARCVETNNWPGYPAEIQELS